MPPQNTPNRLGSIVAIIVILVVLIGAGTVFILNRTTTPPTVPLARTTATGKTTPTIPNAGTTSAVNSPQAAPNGAAANQGAPLLTAPVASSEANSARPGSMWVRVPAGNTGEPDLFVMKYEAKVDLDGDGWGDYNRYDGIQDYRTFVNIPYKIVSSPAGSPVTYITRTQAMAECNKLGNGYNLISNEEWYQVAMNAANVADNWSGGVVGQGLLYTGNINDPTRRPSEAFENNAWPEKTRSRKLVLSSGDEIWDVSGNVWDLTRDTYSLSELPKSMTVNEYTWEYSNTNVNWGPKGADYFGPVSKLWGRDTGVGTFTNSTVANEQTRLIIMRGGDTGSEFNGGAFTAVVNREDTAVRQANTGFRCSYYSGN